MRPGVRLGGMGVLFLLVHPIRLRLNRSFAVRILGVLKSIIGKHHENTPHVMAAAIAACALGCKTSDSGRLAPNREDLVGNWKWEKHETECGPVEAILTFTDSGTIELRNIFLVDEDEPAYPRMISKGAFEIREGKLTSEVLYKGKPVAIWFERGCLCLSAESEISGPFRRVE